MSRDIAHSRAGAPAHTASARDASEVSLSFPVDVYETRDAIEMVAEMPGVGERDLHIELDRDVLTLVGRPAEAAPKDMALAYGEWQPGVYRRAFTLATEVERKAIRAKMRDGVLMLHLPKAEPARAHVIKVEG